MRFELLDAIDGVVLRKGVGVVLRKRLTGEDVDRVMPITWSEIDDIIEFLTELKKQETEDLVMPTIIGQEIEDHLKRLGATKKQLAKRIKRSRKTVSQMINGKGRITADMAWRLSRALNTSAIEWMERQAERDLEKAMSKNHRKYDRIVPLHPKEQPKVLVVENEEEDDYDE